MKVKLLTFALCLLVTISSQAQKSEVANSITLGFPNIQFDTNLPLHHKTLFLISGLDDPKSQEELKKSLKNFFGSSESQGILDLVVQHNHGYWDFAELLAPQNLSRVDTLKYAPRLSLPIFSDDKEKAVIIAYRLLDPFEQHVLLLKKEQDSSHWKIIDRILTGLYFDRDSSRKKDH